MLAPSLALLLLAHNALAHLQLAWPFPLHSSLNPATPEADKDYSMTSPLISDGTYPCKGFINNPASDMFSTVTWTAGSSYNYTIAGTATHGGGSCQLAMSYDSGTTWNVILSHIGGCPIDGMTQTFTLPSEAPSGEALFAWNWFNREGNREMYQNCAVVTVENGGSGLTGPTPFVANAGVNDCTTIENIDVVFPDPGSNIVWGGSYSSSPPTTAAGYTGSNCVGPGASSSGDAGGAAGATISTSGASTSDAASVSVSGAASATASATASTSALASDVQGAIVAAASQSSRHPVSSADAATSAVPSESASSAAPSSSASSESTCKRRKRSQTLRRAPPALGKRDGSSGVSRNGHPRPATRPGKRDMFDERDGSSGVSRAGHPLAATRPGKRDSDLDERDGSSGVSRAGHPLAATRPGSRRSLDKRASSGVSRNGHPRPATKPGKRSLVDRDGSSGVSRAGHPLAATRPNAV